MPLPLPLLPLSLSLPPPLPFNVDKFTTKTRIDSIKSTNTKDRKASSTSAHTWHCWVIGNGMPRCYQIELMCVCVFALVYFRVKTSNYYKRKTKTMNSIRIRFINFPCSSFKAVINQNCCFRKDRSLCLYVCALRAVDTTIWLFRSYIEYSCFSLVAPRVFHVTKQNQSDHSSQSYLHPYQSNINNNNRQFCICLTIINTKPSHFPFHSIPLYFNTHSYSTTILKAHHQRRCKISAVCMEI